MMVIKRAPFVQELLDDMWSAMELLEAGDTEKAYRLLEHRCEPEEELTTPPAGMHINAHRVAKQILENAPEGVIRQTDAYSLEHLAYRMERLLRDPDKPRPVREIVEILSHASEFGVALVVPEDTTDTDQPAA